MAAAAVLRGAGDGGVMVEVWWRGGGVVAWWRCGGGGVMGAQGSRLGLSDREGKRENGERR